MTANLRKSHTISGSRLKIITVTMTYLMQILNPHHQKQPPQITPRHLSLVKSVNTLPNVN